MSRCSWNSDGVQCKWPGTFSPGLNGGGPWRCFWHRELGADFESQAKGRAATDASYRWDESPEACWAAREASKPKYIPKNPDAEDPPEQVAA